MLCSSWEAFCFYHCNSARIGIIQQSKHYIKCIFIVVCNLVHCFVTLLVILMSKKNKGFRRCSYCSQPKSTAVTNHPKKRKQWTEQQMLSAMESATRMSANKAAAKHGVPPSILKDWVSGRVKHGTKPGPAPYLNQQEEKALTDHLILSAHAGFGKTCRDVMNFVERYVTVKPFQQCISLNWVVV